MVMDTKLSTYQKFILTVRLKYIIPIDIMVNGSAYTKYFLSKKTVIIITTAKAQ